MSKRPADVVLEVYNGASGTNPGMYRGNISCRVVAIQRKVILTAPFNSIKGYVTHTSPLIRVAKLEIDPPFFKCDPTFGSYLLNPLTGFECYVLYTERITPRVGSFYLRSWFTQ